MYHWARGPDIPAENNRAERGVRGLVIARKTSFGGQSEGALRVREVNQSAIETLALRHADSAGKLAKALNNYAATGKKSDVREFLLPPKVGWTVELCGAPLPTVGVSTPRCSVTHYW